MLLRLLTFVLTLFSLVPTRAQETVKLPNGKTLSKNEKKKLIKKVSPKGEPVIVYDGTIYLFPVEFLEKDYEVNEYMFREPKEGSSYQGWDTKDGLIFAYSSKYRTESEKEFRNFDLEDYRKNEIETFFGNCTPLILYGDKEISVKQYISLPEEDVAFVNFYIKDFVKSYYGKKAKDGVVVVWPRKDKSTINYTTDLDLPANGRNYIHHLSFESLIHLTEEHNGIYGFINYIREELKKNKMNLDKDVVAQVDVSCVVHTDGRVEPFFIEDFKNANSKGLEQRDQLIKIAQDMIKELPKVILNFNSLLSKYKSHTIIDYREQYLKLSIPFGRY